MRRLNGWIRLWIVGSVLLLIVLGWSLYLTLATAEAEARLGHVRDAAITFVLWSGGALLAGMAIAWILRGFARDAGR